MSKNWLSKEQFQWVNFENVASFKGKLTTEKLRLVKYFHLKKVKKWNNYNTKIQYFLYTLDESSILIQGLGEKMISEKLHLQSEYKCSFNFYLTTSSKNDKLHTNLDENLSFRGILSGLKCVFN